MSSKLLDLSCEEVVDQVHIDECKVLLVPINCVQLLLSVRNEIRHLMSQVVCYSQLLEYESRTVLDVSAQSKHVLVVWPVLDHHLDVIDEHCDLVITQHHVHNELSKQILDLSDSFRISEELTECSIKQTN